MNEYAVVSVCEKLPCGSRVTRLPPSNLQGHVRKAQALVSLGRMEEALREYLVCLSIEPDCRLAKTEAHKVNPFLCSLRQNACLSHAKRRLMRLR